jgi:hypothetical protein
MRRLLSLVVLFAALAAALAVTSAPVGAVSCEDEFTGAVNNEWTNTGNWATGKLPTSATIACFATGKTPQIASGTQEVDSIESGGSLELTGGSLKIVSASDASALNGAVLLQGGTLTVEDTTTAAELKITGGTLGGSGTMSVSGPVKWVGESGGLSGTVKVKQASGSTFAIEGTGRFYFYGGSVETGSPVTIGDPEFINNHAGGQFFTTTSTLTLAPIEFNENGGSSTVFSANGILTTGNTVVRNFTLDATGGDSKIEGGTLTVPGLSTSAGATVNVGSGADLDVTGGTDTLAGTITGKGTFTAGGGTETVESGGVLSTEALKVSGAQLKVAAGATFAIPTLTTIALGSLACDTATTTGTLKITGGTLEGSGTMTVSGAVTWVGEGGGLSGTVELKQASGSTFAIEGTGRFYFYGGSVETGSPVTIGDPEFITANNAQFKTTSTITLAPGYDVPVNGGDNATFTAAGVAANSGPEYGFGADNLVLTGGTTTVSSGHTLKSGPLTVSGGVLQDDGTVEPASGSTTLTGGTLGGTGEVNGSLTNTAGVLEPGDGVPGELYVSGEYTQETGGTLAIRIKGFLPDTGYAQVRVKGHATFGGQLSLTDEGGYVPEPVHELEVLKSEGGNSGAFSALVGPSAGLYNVAYVTSGSLSGAWLMAKPPPAPVNTQAPEITGTPAAGQTLTCPTGTWTNTPTKYEYQWSLEGKSISGATEAEYVVPTGVEGQTLTCTVTASNAGGAGTPVTSAGVTVIAPPLNTAPPAVSGNPVVGGVLTCSTGTWSGTPTSFTYQWYRAGVPIAGATSNTYLVQVGDEGQTLTCVVTASNGAGPAGAVTSAGVSVPTPLAVVPTPVVPTSPVVPSVPSPLQCSGKAIVLLSVRSSGHAVVLSGLALTKFAGQKVKITVSDVPKRYAKGKGGSTVVTSAGTFEAKLPEPTGRLAPLTRYTATVAGQSSLGLKLGRTLKITGDTPVAGGAQVSFQFGGHVGATKHTVTITRQVSCTQETTFESVALPRNGRLTVTLPAPSGAGGVSYYRAQTKTSAGVTYSLPIAVANGG